jgi:hypothetical protein
VPIAANLALTAILMQNAPVIELRTFADDADPRSRGISVVAINTGSREIAMWKSYDGLRNRLISRVHGFTIALSPPAKATLQPVKIAPGSSQTLFTVSMDSIFFLRQGAFEEGWRWGWQPPSPRGAPPLSPFHGHRSLGWELRRATSATLAAVAEVDGVETPSQPLEIKIAPPQFTTVEVLVRFTAARESSTERMRFYEMAFDVLKTNQGHLNKTEQTMRLPDSTAEPLMKAAGAQLDQARKDYVFTGPRLLLKFARLGASEQDAGRLVLMQYGES